MYVCIYFYTYKYIFKYVYLFTCSIFCLSSEKADVKNLDHSCKENETIELSMSCLEEKPEVVARNGLETLKQLYDSSENDDSSDDENDSIQGFAFAFAFC